ncbi:MAG: hypothetical protein COW63_02155 [Bacteroidetes bacterium CG18_big_fil_WC_8_21_14_2_50_41_14]|nr:MAG: hypothetical protein COW63_02155 [Bacteroidetes bacterium CG18_big_fil_WC_8_21_14_2_50_41_14]PIY30677.1 MAG: hypothetical protein COZ08_11565 [Bacteroidetes bacterium CG_4_10_14_3_um_filter_42_6]
MLLKLFIHHKKIEIMKTIILTLSLVLIATFSFAQFPQSDSPDSCSYVTTDLRASIYMDNNALVNVKVAKHVGDQVKIRVKENNKILYQKSFKSWALIDLKYDIDQFPMGEYTFEIVKDKEVVFAQTIKLEETDGQLVLR